MSHHILRVVSKGWRIEGEGISSSMDIDDEDVDDDDDDVIHSAVSEDVVLISSSMDIDDEDDKSSSISTSVQPPITLTVETSWISVHILPV